MWLWIKIKEYKAWIIGLIVVSSAVALGAPAPAQYITAPENNTFTIGRNNFQTAFKGDISESNALQYRLNGKFIGFTPLGMKWDNEADYFLSNATSTSYQSKGDTIIEKASETSPRILSDKDERAVFNKITYNNIFLPKTATASTSKKINIQVNKTDRIFNKVIKIDSLADLGTIPAGAKHLSIEYEVDTNFIIDGWNKESDFEITDKVRIGDYSYLEPARVWDEYSEEVCNIVDEEEICETLTHNVQTKSFLKERNGKFILEKQITVDWLRASQGSMWTDADVTYGTASTFDNTAVFNGLLSTNTIDTDKFVTCLSRGGTTSEGVCGVGTVNGTTITYGAAVTYVADVRGEWQYSAKIDTDKFVVCYADDGQLDDGYCRVSTVTGVEIDGFGTADEFETGDAEEIVVIGINESTDTFVVCYNDESSSNTAKCVANTVSGTTITTGTPTDIAATDYYYRMAGIDDVETDKFVTCWNADDSPDLNYCVAATVSTRTITFGTPIAVNYSSVGTTFSPVEVNVNSTSDAVICYRQFSPAVRQCIPLSISGTTLATTTTATDSWGGESASFRGGNTVIDSTHTLSLADSAAIESVYVTADFGTPLLAYGDIESIDTVTSTGSRFGADLLSTDKVIICYAQSTDTVTECIVGNVSDAPTKDDYSHFQTLTICGDGGGSGCAATTTTNGYAMLATTTDAVLAVTGSGGRITQTTYNSANNSEEPIDLAFFNDGGDLLDFCIESYATTTGEIVVWIEVDDISSTTPKTFDMAYGNASDLGWQNCAGVYNDTYVGVWNFPEDPTSTAPQMLDSTGNSNHGTSVGSMTQSDQVDAIVDGGLDLDGGDDALLIPNSTSLNITGPITMTAWIKTGNTGDHIIGGYQTSGGFPGYGFSVGVGGGAILTYWSGAHGSWVDGNTDVNDDEWHHAVVAVSGTTAQFYLDGVADGSPTTEEPNTYSNTRALGARRNGSEGLNGLIDEVRIYNTAIHGMDILTDYNMQVDNTTFLSFGAEQATGEEDANATGKYQFIKGAWKFIKGAWQFK